MTALIISCATGRGNLFETVVSAEEEKDKPSKKDEQPEYQLLIKTVPPKADIYLNNIYRGETPLYLDDLETGSYSLSIRKEGYHTEERWIRIRKGEYTEIEVELRQITGYVHIKTTPTDSFINADSFELEQGLNELPVGEYLLKVRAFGYKEWRQRVAVHEDITSEVTVTLEKADFELKNIQTSRKRLNPENPGTLGRAKITFLVTAPGKGEAVIYNRESEIVFSYHFPDFTTWEQSFLWNGKDSSGKKLKDGVYTVLVRAGGYDTDVEKTLQTEITIDRSFVIRFRSIWSGNSGLLYAGSTEVLPKSSFQFSFLFMGHREKIDNTYLSRFPAQIGIRFSPLTRLEVLAQVTAILQTGAPNPFSLGLSGKYLIFNTGKNPGIGTAVTVKTTYLRGEYIDTLTNYYGLSAGLPFQLNLGPASLIFSPEITVSPLKVSYYPGFTPDPGFYVWGYARTGFLLDFRDFSGAISVAFRSLPFFEDFALHPPVAGGIEMNWVVPDTQMVLSATVSGEFESMANFYIMGGGGIGLLD
mgnify:CR=1 FL=1